MPVNPYWPQYRTVVLDRRAQEFVDLESSRTPRFDDQWRGVEWRLARRPDTGIPRLAMNQTDFLVYVFPANEFATTRELWVLYSYNQDRVTIHAARFGDVVADD